MGAASRPLLSLPSTSVVYVFSGAVDCVAVLLNLLLRLEGIKAVSNFVVVANLREK